MLNPIQSATELAVTSLKQGNLSVCEFYYLPTEIRLRAAMTPERLPESCYYQLSVRDPKSVTQLVNGFHERVQNTTFKKSAFPVDARYGIVFKKSDQTVISRVFLNQAGTSVTVGTGAGVYQVSGTLPQWFYAVGRQLARLKVL